MKIEFEEIEHAYKLNDRVVPSVTTIIKEVIGIGWEADGWYLQRGTAIHKCAELIARGKEFRSDERLSGYVIGLRRFFAEVNPEILSTELRVASEVYQFAGTLDLLCKIGGKNVIADYKHSVDHVRVPLQLAGYSIALKETTGHDFKFGAGIQIKASGEYQMTEIMDLTRAKAEFLALRTSYTIKKRAGKTA